MTSFYREEQWVAKRSSSPQARSGRPTLNWAGLALEDTPTPSTPLASKPYHFQVTAGDLRSNGGRGQYSQCSKVSIEWVLGSKDKDWMLVHSEPNTKVHTCGFVVNLVCWSDRGLSVSVFLVQSFSNTHFHCSLAVSRVAVRLRLIFGVSYWSKLSVS
jgi:hypothetical protein